MTEQNGGLGQPTFNVAPNGNAFHIKIRRGANLTRVREVQQESSLEQVDIDQNYSYWYYYDPNDMNIFSYNYLIYESDSKYRVTETSEEDFYNVVAIESLSKVDWRNYQYIDYSPIEVHKYNPKKEIQELKKTETIKIRFAMAQYLRAEGFRTRFAAKMTFFNMFGLIHPYDTKIIEWWTNTHWIDDYNNDPANLERAWRTVFLQAKTPDDAPVAASLFGLIGLNMLGWELGVGFNIYEYEIFENLAFYGNLSNTLIYANYDKIRNVLEYL